MKLRLEALTPTLSGDYFDFFDNVGFADHQEWSACYCTYYHMTRDEEKRLDACGADALKAALREKGRRMVAEGSMNGYLAYGEDGRVVGWCNAGDKSGFGRLCADRALWEGAAEGERVKAVVCFLIAPGARGQGVATALLQRVCDDALSEGWDALEAYPITTPCDQYMHYHGPLSLYEKQGFVLQRQFERYAVVRKTLKAQA